MFLDMACMIKASFKVQNRNCASSRSYSFLEVIRWGAMANFGLRYRAVVSAQHCYTGKTTFIRMLHGSVKADDEEAEIPGFNVSYKPQKISPKFPGSVILSVS